MTLHVAFLGLGVMGYPMAGWLSKAGHRVSVYNRTAEKAERWAAEHGGRKAASVAEAVEDADFVFTCVGDDPDVREVVLGPDGALTAMRKGAVLVDHTTASATLARSEEHTSELQSRENLVCRLLLDKKKNRALH